MRKKSRANEYCDICKKIHRKGRCIELSPKEHSKVTANAAMFLMMRAAKNMYLSRDWVGDSKDFIESDVVKESDSDKN